MRVSSCRAFSLMGSLTIAPARRRGRLHLTLECRQSGGSGVRPASCARTHLIERAAEGKVQALPHRARRGQVSSISQLPCPAEQSVSATGPSRASIMAAALICGRPGARADSRRAGRGSRSPAPRAAACLRSLHTVGAAMRVCFGERGRRSARAPARPRAAASSHGGVVGKPAHTQHGSALVN